MTIQRVECQSNQFLRGGSLWPGIILWLMSITTHAQPGDYGTWNSYAINGKLNERWSTVGDYQFRFYDFKGDLQQILLRSFLQYNLGKGWEAGTGYTFSLLQRYVNDEDKQDVIEHRFTQQVIYARSFSRFTVGQRLRLEERYVSGDWSYRLRYFISARCFLTDKNTWYVSAFDEYFFQLDGFVMDQNRLFTGLGIRFNDHFRLDCGNLLQTFPNGRRNQLFTQLTHSFAWKKSKSLGAK